MNSAAALPPFSRSTPGPVFPPATPSFPPRRSLPEWRLSIFWPRGKAWSFRWATKAAAVADIAVELTGAIEPWVRFGSSLDRAWFPSIGAQGNKIGGDHVEQVRPNASTLGRIGGLGARAAKAAQGVGGAGETEVFRGNLVRGGRFRHV